MRFVPPPTVAVAEPSGAKAVYFLTVAGSASNARAGTAAPMPARDCGCLQPVPAAGAVFKLLATSGRRVRRLREGSSAAEQQSAVVSVNHACASLPRPPTSDALRVVRVIYVSNAIYAAGQPGRPNPALRLPPPKLPHARAELLRTAASLQLYD